MAVPSQLYFALWVLFHTFVMCSAYDNDCTDLLDNCEMFTKYACEGPYKPWASVRCRAYCGFCQPPPTSPPPCRDVIPNCDIYQSDTCTNPDYHMWARYNCFKFCKFCQPEPEPSTRTPMPTPPSTVNKTPPPVIFTTKMRVPPKISHRTTPHPPMLIPPRIRTPPPPVGRR
ncbi:uncharacterized protein LOC135479819 [Liolophura sinensis]|uniref:uncharacterized protein LOC135479819 n=1 Tax=Liolophura sinensis TaxID=3198878 RepID=UPI0031587097